MKIELFHEAYLKRNFKRLVRRRNNVKTPEDAISVVKEINKVFRLYFHFFNSWDRSIDQMHFVYMGEGEEKDLKMFLVKRVLEDNILTTKSFEVESEPMKELVEEITEPEQLDVGFSVMLSEVT